MTNHKDYREIGANLTKQLGSSELALAYVMVKLRRHHTTADQQRDLRCTTSASVTLGVIKAELKRVAGVD